MRRVSRWASRVAPLLAVLVVFTAGSAWAGEPAVPPADPPQARVSPPVGISAEKRISPPVGIAAQHRIQPPVGAPTSDARLNPPVGAPTLTQVILIWLQSRISLPNA